MYVRGKYIHAMNGRAVGQLNGTHVHKFSGQYVGELHRDMVVDKGLETLAISEIRETRVTLEIRGILATEVPQTTAIGMYSTNCLGSYELRTVQ
jgi:hypothetical protein